MTGEFIDRLEAHIIPQKMIGEVNFQSMVPLSITVLLGLHSHWLDMKVLHFF